MANSHDLCMGCMNPLPAGRSACGICGYPADGQNPPQYLAVGTVLSDRYLVGCLLESGGDCAIYMGFDQVLKAAIRIREFFPETLCERAEDGAVRVLGGCENTFRDYLERFRAHARALARMRDIPAMVPLYDIFEQNNTAYTVGEHCEGITLEARLAQLGGRMSWDDARPLFMPLMSSLMSLHTAGIYHLGICPANLLIGADGKLRLTGFCIPEVRSAGSELKAQLIKGYSAPEQYGFEMIVTPATDVYGLAATIFRTLTGNPPPLGSARAANANDLLVPSDVARTLPDHVAAALFHALQTSPDKRIATIGQFRDRLAAAPAVSALLKDEKPAPIAAAPAAAETPKAENERKADEKKSGRGKYAVLIVVSVFLVLLLLAGAVIVALFPDVFMGGGESSSWDTPSSTQTTLAISSDTSSYVPPTNQYSVPNVMGLNYYEQRSVSLIGEMKLEVEYKKYSDRPKGEILSQTPSQGNGAEKGTVIKVVISAGPEQLAVPDVSGWEEEQAKLYLEALGFKVDSVKVVVSDYERGKVQETSPPAGSSLLEGETVTLRVSDKEPEEPASSDPWWTW